MLLPILWLSAVAAPEPALAAYMPCTPGLAVRYEHSDENGKLSDVHTKETVRGPGKEAHTCVVDRVTERAGQAPTQDAWLFELLDDRVTNAGWLATPTAFRPPYFKAPLARGNRWVFNRTQYEIVEVGTTFDVPAGTFESCLRVTEESMPKGAHRGFSVYCAGVGLVLSDRNGRQTRAVAVDKPKAENAPAVLAPQAVKAKPTATR